MDAKSYVNSLNKSVNDKRQDIHGELYVGRGRQIAKTLIPTAVAALIIGISGYMANKHSLAEDVRATIDREINDDDNFVLDQVRLSEMKEERNYKTEDLYQLYKEAGQAIDNNEDGSKIVHFRDKDIEIDQTLVNYLLMENEDGLFSISDKKAEALALSGQFLYDELENDLNYEKNNASVRR